MLTIVPKKEFIPKPFKKNMSDQTFFSIKIGGQAGQGIKSAGLTLSKVATRSGFNIHTYTEFPSLIRGGHNVEQILISREDISTPLQKTDLLIALNQDTINKHAAELLPGSGAMFDADKRIDTSKLVTGVNLYPVPLSKLAGLELLINTVALGATIALLGGKVDLLYDLIRLEYSDKGEELISKNISAAKSGYDFVRQSFADQLNTVLASLEKIEQKMIVNGAEAVALGAIAGGLQFASIYPMSPISGILQALAVHQEKYGYIYKQPEDEIAALTMAIGAGFAGARSMTATSGGGFCLMTEGLGLAAMTETPVVIINGMRPGPATGLPSWSGQGDLQFILHAHQGTIPRIVLAAGDGLDAFNLTMKALNLAQKYQTPVILLIDKNICDDDQSYPVFDISGYQLNSGKFTTDFNPNFARYAQEEDGISYRTIPGTGNFFIANSDEHLEAGFSTEESADVVMQADKRMRKQATCEKEDMQPPELFGPASAEITLVSWGSNKNNILHAIRDTIGVNYLHITWMSPFPTAAVKDVLGKAKHIIDIECNSTGQLAELIAEKTGILITDKLLKYDGRPIYPEEIITKLNSSNV